MKNFMLVVCLVFIFVCSCTGNKTLRSRTNKGDISVVKIANYEEYKQNREHYVPEGKADVLRELIERKDQGDKEKEIKDFIKSYNLLFPSDLYLISYEMIEFERKYIEGNE